MGIVLLRRYARAKEHVEQAANSDQVDQRAAGWVMEIAQRAREIQRRERERG